MSGELVILVIAALAVAGIGVYAWREVASALRAGHEAGANKIRIEVLAAITEFQRRARTAPRQRATAVVPLTNRPAAGRFAAGPGPRNGGGHW